MPLQNNAQTIFIGRLVFLYALLLLFQACINTSGNSEQNTNDGALVTQTNQENIVDSNVPSTITVIPEQDPNGIFWGLRDTISGKLVLDYTYQKIWDFKDGFAIIRLNGKSGLINKIGKVIIGPDYDYPKPEIDCGFIAFEIGNGPVAIIDTTGKSVMPLVFGMTGWNLFRTTVV